MTAEEKQKLEDGGINVDEAMRRFMNNEKLLMRFLQKFKEDMSYENLIKAMEEKDCEKAFEAAHTLKGVAGNLAMTKFYAMTGEQTDYLRGKDFEAAQAMMPGVSEAYERIIQTIKEVYGA